MSAHPPLVRASDLPAIPAPGEAPLHLLRARFARFRRYRRVLRDLRRMPRWTRADLGMEPGRLREVARTLAESGD